MIKLFLKARHWQLFLLSFGIPFIVQLLLVGSLMARLINDPEPQPEIIFNYFSYFPFLIIISVGTLFGWYWAVALGLQNRLPAEVKLKKTRFKFFFFFPLIYIAAFLVLFLFLSSPENFASGNPTVNPKWIAMIIPLHLLAMFSVFYCIYFTAKTLKSIEMQRRVKFNEYIGEFFMIWFFPIGIWILQPKINRLESGESLVDDFEF